jgi:hypothetical protein
MSVPRRVLIAVLCACALSPAARADVATTERFAVIQNGEKVGYVVAARRGGQVDVDFRIDNNGRGARSRERLTLDPQGIPIAWHIEGNGDAGYPVREDYAFKDGRATWKTLDDAGSAAAATAPVYIPKDTSPWALQIAARAALAAREGVVHALPSGELRMTKVREVRVGKDGPPLTAYALHGVDLRPQLLLLDGSRRLVAWVSAWQQMIDEPQAGEWAALRDLALDLDRELLVRFARDMAHRVPGPIYIRNVHVFDAVAGRSSGPTTVVVYGTRVLGVRPDATPEPGAAVVDGEGGTILPGLHDMHAHMAAWDGAYDLAAGVTSVRDPGNDNQVLLDLTALVDRGEIVGPRIARSGFLEGRSPFSERGGGFVVDSLPVALEKVRWYADHGYRQIKIYNSLDPDWVKPVAAEAHRLGLTVHGHVPAFMTSERAVRDGYDEITHVNQLMLSFVIDAKEDTRTAFRFTALGERLGKLDLASEPVQRMIRLMKERHVALDPTAAVFAQFLLGRPGKASSLDEGWLDAVPAPVQRSRRSAVLDVKPAQYPAYEASWRKVLETIRLLDAEGTGPTSSSWTATRCRTSPASAGRGWS